MEGLDKNIVINHIIPFLTYKERIKLYNTCRRFWAMNTGEYIHPYCWQNGNLLKIHHYIGYELLYYKNKKFRARLELKEFADGSCEYTYNTTHYKDKINVKALLKDYMYHFKDNMTTTTNKRIKLK